MSGPRWMGLCAGCNREAELESRESHGMRALCDSCNERPYQLPRAHADDFAAPASTNGKAAEPAAEDLAAWLTGQLGLGDVGLQVTGANVFGRGPNASVDLHLSDGSRMTFDRFGDVAKPAALSAYVATMVGLYRPFKGPQAGKIAAAISKLARHHAEASADDAASEWGAEYLRVARKLEVDLGHQGDRWHAFSVLGELSPASDAGEDRSAHALAAASCVLIDSATGERLVRTGWFQAYVKREVGGLYSPAALAVQMQRVGWLRRNSEGRVKATCPTDGRHLGWSFYTVPAGWEDRPEPPQVPAGSSVYARVHAHARGPVGTPAGTSEPGPSTEATA